MKNADGKRVTDSENRIDEPAKRDEGFWARPLLGFMRWLFCGRLLSMRNAPVLTFWVATPLFLTFLPDMLAALVVLGSQAAAMHQNGTSLIRVFGQPLAMYYLAYLFLLELIVWLALQPERPKGGK